MDTPIPCELFAQAVAQSQDGMTISDAQHNLLYVNQGFEKLTGYSAAEIIRLGYSVLQGEDTQQAAVAHIRHAITHGESCVVTLRNYRRDGTMFWNELSLSPVRNEQGALTHYIGIQKDVTARVLLERYLHQSNLDLRLLNQQLNAAHDLDPLVSLSNFQHFNDTFATLLSGAQHMHHALAVLVMEIGHFAAFNTRYGVQAGDECLQRVGMCIAKAYTRHSDCTTRYEEEKFIAISLEAGLEEVRSHAQKLCDKVRALGIPHSDAPQGVITLNIGGVVRIPQRGNTREELLRQAEEQLHFVQRHAHDLVRIVN